MSKKFQITSNLIEEANKSLENFAGYPTEDNEKLIKSSSIKEIGSLKNVESSFYENMAEKITSSLSKIEKKIDLDIHHLKKLDKLDKLDKLKLNEFDVLKKKKDHLENNKITEKTNEPEIENSGNNNLPDKSEILNRVDEIDKKVQQIEKGVVKNENTNKSFQKRFTNIENTMDRFETLEKEIKIEYEEDDNTSKKKKYLKISLLLFLVLFFIMIIGDRLGFVDLYIDEVIGSIFLK